MPGTWFPGQVAAGGAKVFNNPVIINGVTTLQKGVASYPPAVTTPGTIASAGTIANNTGVDVMVYMNATTTLNTIKISGNTVAGSVAANTTASYYVPANGTLSLVYTGTLTWTWLAV